MDHARDRDDVSQPVQRLPQLAAQPPDHAVGRGRRQRHHEHQAERAHHQVGTLDDLRQSAAGARPAVEPEEDQKMQAGVKERVQPQHPTELAQPAPAGDSTQRSDEECEDQEYQREQPGRPDGEVDRVGAELAPPGVPTEDDGRHGAVE